MVESKDFVEKCDNRGKLRHEVSSIRIISCLMFIGVQFEQSLLNAM